ncbi:MAG: hypothetical protein ACOYT9_01735 [Patescibacteria group bacterium]
MKLRLFLTGIVVTTLLLSFPVASENLNSTNYTLIDTELSSAAGSTSSNNYKTLVQGGNGVEFGQISSTLYKIGSGQGYTFMANVPKLTCFETTTDSGTTTCTGLPAGNGMVGECGLGGCYDRAMFQIDTQGNPTDTLYSIQVSKDNWSTIYVVDGTTHQLKAYSSKAIGDYRTKSQWESTPWNSANLMNLSPNTEYKMRVTALHGDFTETPPGPSKTTTTALPTLSFDIDIGADINANSNAPYAVDFGALNPETPKFLTTQRIKLEVSTNAQSGVSLYVRDQFSGLRSTSTNYTLQSSTEDLSNPASQDGFGLQKTSTSQSVVSQGYMISSSTYDVAGSNVGSVSSLSHTLAACSLVSSSGVCTVDTPTWVDDGRILFTLGARAALSAPSVSDYTDQLSFSAVGGW